MYPSWWRGPGESLEDIDYEGRPWPARSLISRFGLDKDAQGSDADIVLCFWLRLSPRSRFSGSRHDLAHRMGNTKIGSAVKAEAGNKDCRPNPSLERHRTSVRPWTPHSRHPLDIRFQPPQRRTQLKRAHQEGPSLDDPSSRSLLDDPIRPPKERPAPLGQLRRVFLPRHLGGAVYPRRGGYGCLAVPREWMRAVRGLDVEVGR